MTAWRTILVVFARYELCVPYISAFKDAATPTPWDDTEQQEADIFKLTRSLYPWTFAFPPMTFWQPRLLMQCFWAALTVHSWVEASWNSLPRTVVNILGHNCCTKLGMALKTQKHKTHRCMVNNCACTQVCDESNANVISILLSQSNLLNFFEKAKYCHISFTEVSSLWQT